MAKDLGAEHLYIYYLLRLGDADYASKYDATPNHLQRMWHVGAFYFDRLKQLMESLG